MKKPKNLKKVYTTYRYFECINPYVSCLFETKPLRVTLDGQFGIKDLEYIVARMKKVEIKNKEMERIKKQYEENHKKKTERDEDEED